jgi:hypothetical protein
LAKGIEDFMMMQNIADTKESSVDGNGKKISSEVFEKVENGDLKALLSQTSKLNSVNSVAQFQ